MSENTVRDDAINDEHDTHAEPAEPAEARDPDTTGEGPQAGSRPQAPRGPSAPTVVFGLMLAVVATLVLGHELELFEVDPVTSGVWLLMGSGALLVVWALISMVGRRGDNGERD